MSPPQPIIPGPGRIRQNEIYRAGVQGRTPAVPTDFATLERRARRHARKLGWAYAAGGAGEGATMRANREAFERYKIVPRMLRDVSRRDLTVELFGRTLPAPVLFGPVGAAELLDAGRGPRDRAGGGGGRCPVRVHQPGVRVDGGVRGGDGRRAEVVSAVLVDRRRLGRQLPGARRGGRLRGGRGDARHDDARLAADGSQPRVAAVRARAGDRAVHRRQSFHGDRPRADRRRRGRRRRPGRRRQTVAGGVADACIRSAGGSRAGCWATSARPSRAPRCRRSWTSTRGRR